METINVIIKEIEKFNQSIIDTLNDKKITNTGEAARSLRIESYENFVRSIGIFYLEFLDTGRGSGNPPPYLPIRKWVMTKLGISDEKEIERVTYSVQRKIMLLGTEIFLNNGKGIELEKKISELRENVNIELKNLVKFEITNKLQKYKDLYKQKFKI